MAAEKIEFIKAVASGNDFIILDRLSCRNSPKVENLGQLAQRLCQRKLSVGADGLLVIEPAKKADLLMRIFNPDGREVEMCGNGSRCVALYASQNQISASGKVTIQTKAGYLYAEVSREKVKIKMTDPEELRLKFDLDLGGQMQNVNYVRTGVPHVVCFVKDLEHLNVNEFGKLIRYHSEFQPEGTNANFVQVLALDHIRIRTYERGVEEETLSCGTGCVAAGIVTTFDMKENPCGVYKVKVDTKSGERLGVYFKVDKDAVGDVFLEGEARMVYKGTI